MCVPKTSIVINLGTDFDVDTWDKMVLQDDDEVCDITKVRQVGSAESLRVENDGSIYSGIEYEDEYHNVEKIDQHTQIETNGASLSKINKDTDNHEISEVDSKSWFKRWISFIKEYVIIMYTLMKAVFAVVLGLVALVVFLKYYARMDSQRIKTVFRIIKKIKQNNSEISEEELVKKVIKSYSDEYDKSGLFEKMLEINQNGINLIEGLCKHWSIKNLTMNILMWDNIFIFRKEIKSVATEKLRKQVDDIYQSRGMSEYE